MKVFTDDNLLKLNTAMATAYAVPFLAAPKESSDFLFGEGTNMMRHFGVGVGGIAGLTGAAISSKDTKMKKNALKVMGAGLLVCGTTMLVENRKKKEITMPLAVGSLVTGVANLVQGFRKETTVPVPASTTKAMIVKH